MTQASLIWIPPTPPPPPPHSVNYLNNQTLWNICLEPANVVLWNLVLFSILLGLGTLEMVLCGAQVVNGLLGTVCGDCRKAAEREVRRAGVQLGSQYLGTPDEGS